MADSSSKKPNVPLEEGYEYNEPPKRPATPPPPPVPPRKS